MKNNDWN